MSNGISSGASFPSSVNVGALHFKVDEGVYYRYLGGGVATDALNWVVFGGVIDGDPDTTGWGERQDGALWFNGVLNVLRVWNGTAIQSVGVGAYSTLEQNGISVPDRSILDVVGRNALVDDTGGITTRFRMNDPNTMSYVYDEFIGGSTALFAGVIGELGWFGNQSGSGSVIQPTLVLGDISHPGVKGLSTGTGVGAYAFIHLPSTTAFNLFLIDNSFDTLWVVNLRQGDANTRALCGLGTGALPTALSGIRVEKDFADTEWFAFTGNGIGTTRVSLGGVVAGQWEKFRIRKVGAGIGFTRNDGGEVIINTTIFDPATGLGMHAYVENDSAADKIFDMDYVDVLITGLTR